VKAASVFVVIAFLAASLLPLAAADDDSLKVIVVIEDKTYSTGTSGKLTVHVFDKGKHADPDTAPTVEIGIYPNRDISVTKKSTGVYEGTFTLQGSDAFMGHASVSATATLGKSGPDDTSYNEDTGGTAIMLPGYTAIGLAVDCHLKSLNANVVRPGAVVTLETKVTFNGTAVDPTRFELTVSYYDRGYDETTVTLNTTKLSTGVYEATYTIPSLDYDTTLRFSADARYSGDDRTGSTSLSLDFFNIVYHNISKGPTSTVFDLYVADTGGKPVSGATLSITYSSDSSWSDDRTLDAGPTDSKGKARITLTYDNGTERLNVNGKVNASGKSQSFMDTIVLRQAASTTPEPSGEDFEVLLSGSDELYTAGQTVNRDYYVFNDSETWANKEVYAYLVFNSYSLPGTTFTAVSADARTLTTDGGGRMRLPVQTPSGKDTYVQVHFESATGVHDKPDGWYTDHDSADGRYYSEDGDEFMAAREAPGNVVKVTVKELKLGAPTAVEASARSDGRPVAFAGWGIGKVDLFDMSDPDPEWDTWSEIPSVLTRSGSKYTGTVTIPSFMPRDEQYTILVMVDGDSLYSEYGTATLRPGEGTASAAAFPTMYLILVIVLVVAVVAIVVLVKRRRARPAAPADTLSFANAPAAPPPPAMPPTGMAPPGETSGPAFQGAPPAGYAPAPQYPPQPGAPQYSQAPAYQQHPPQPYQQYPPQQYAAPAGAGAPQPVQAYVPPPQPTAVPPPSPIPPPPPSRQGRVTMPNNAICGFCNQWLLQGQTGIMCQCGKYYHDHCARIQDTCGSCGTRLQL